MTNWSPARSDFFLIPKGRVSKDHPRFQTLLEEYASDPESCGFPGARKQSQPQ